MYMYSRLSDTGNFCIAMNVKPLIDVIQRDELIKLGHTRITRVILLSYAFESIDSSPNIVRVIKSRRMRWAGHVARMG